MTSVLNISFHKHDKGKNNTDSFIKNSAFYLHTNLFFLKAMTTNFGKNNNISTGNVLTKIISTEAAFLCNSETNTFHQYKECVLFHILAKFRESFRDWR